MFLSTHTTLLCEKKKKTHTHHPDGTTKKHLDPVYMEWGVPHSM